MIRPRIAFIVCVTLACTCIAGCSSEPSPGEPGAACLPRDGETTPLFCVCGFPCVDGMCIEDPNISCDEALSVAEPDITVEADADEAGPSDADDAATPSDGDIASEELEADADEVTVAGEEEVVDDPQSQGDAVTEGAEDQDTVVETEDVQVIGEETSADTE
jgi:hypothetical protein